MYKKVKFQNLFLCIVCILSAAIIPHHVLAAEGLENTSVTINFQAEVPENFDKDIILKVKNIETNVVSAIILDKSMDYTNSAMLLKNTPVKIEAIIDDNYITNLENSYTFSNAETVDFAVSEDQIEFGDILAMLLPIIYIICGIIMIFMRMDFEWRD